MNRRLGTIRCEMGRPIRTRIPFAAAALLLIVAITPAVFAQPIVRPGHASNAAATTRAADSSARPAPDSLQWPRIALALGLVIAGILILRWCGIRLMGGPAAARSSRAIQVLMRSNLAPRQQLMLIQAGRRLILVANTGANVNTLCQITDADEVAELIGQVRSEKSDSIARTFSNLFGNEKQKFADTPTAPAPAAETSSADPANEIEPEDPSISTTREELAGLMDKVRVLSKHFRA